MKIVIAGGGPSGLYFAQLARKVFPTAHIEVHEQNARGATYGFGIILAERGLERMRKADQASFDAIMRACYMTTNRVIRHPDETVFVEGGGHGGAIARLQLIRILEHACESAGVVLHHGEPVQAEALADADLVVGADGVGSAVRRADEAGFGTRSWQLTNRLAWYGTTRHFPYPMLSFRRFEDGHFVAAAYPYTETMGTFVAECDANTWFSLGMDRMDDSERQRLAEQVFEAELGGAPLLSNNSRWQRLPVVRNRRWSVGNRVLVGDALHSAHPTIGSGTRIAMEDSIALAQALQASPGDIPQALAAFRQLREPSKRKLVQAAEKSFAWYEAFGARMQSLEPVPFVFDFMMRTGRIDDERLCMEYPDFMARYGTRRFEEGEHVDKPAAAVPSRQKAKA